MRNLWTMGIRLSLAVALLGLLWIYRGAAARLSEAESIRLKGHNLQPEQGVSAESGAVDNLAPLSGLLGTAAAVWQLPPGDDPKSIFLLLHGCEHAAVDWFDLPEERAIVRYLLLQGHAVVAISSKDRNSGCWSGGWPASRNPDVAAVFGALRALKAQAPQLNASLPVFAVGASSGGSFAGLLAAAVQDSKGREAYGVNALSGIVVMIAAVRQDLLGSGLPPTVLLPMPRDQWTSPRVGVVERELTRRKVPLLRRDIEARQVHRHSISDAVDEIPPQVSEAVVDKLLAMGLLEGQCDAAPNGECHVTRDPKPDVVVAAAAAAAEAAMGGGARIATYGAPWAFQRGRALLEAQLKEELAVCYGVHEMTAEAVDQWEEWLWQHKDWSPLPAEENGGE